MFILQLLIERSQRMRTLPRSRSAWGRRRCSPGRCRCPLEDAKEVKEKTPKSNGHDRRPVAKPEAALTSVVELSSLSSS